MFILENKKSLLLYNTHIFGNTLSAGAPEKKDE